MLSEIMSLEIYELISDVSVECEIGFLPIGELA